MTSSLYANATFNTVEVSRYFRVRGTDYLYNFQQAHEWSPTAKTNISNLVDNGSYYQRFGNTIFLKSNLTVTYTNAASCTITGLPVEADITSPAQIYQTLAFFWNGTTGVHADVIIDNETDVTMKPFGPVFPAPATLSIYISTFYKAKN